MYLCIKSMQTLALALLLAACSSTPKPPPPAEGKSRVAIPSHPIKVNP